MKSFPSYVGHDWTQPGERTITVENPATGEAFATMPKLGAAEVDRAMRAAKEAQRVWAERPPTERAEVLRRAGDLLEARADEIARDLATEGGRPPKEARGEIAKSVTTFRYYAGLVGALDGRTFAGSAPQQRHETRREPIGVVVAITPWNVPAASPARKLAPALLAGNAVVVKPASATPVSAYHLTRILLEAGLPPGTAQLVTGSGGEVGEALALHKDTAAVSFTGSTEVGLALQQSLANRLTRVQLELGGKNAAVVLPDADLEHAAKQIVAAAFASSGQQCTATSRVIVLREAAEALCEELKRQTEALRVGGTDDDATDMGPLIDRNQLETTRAFVERALAEGADLITGGHELELPGYFYAPTVITNVGRDFEVAREEVFGPLLSVLVVDTLDEAVEVMNDTVYGLSAAVHTRDIGAAQRVVAKTNAGVVAVNGPTAGIELAAPFGGFKLSGTASKEHGPESLDFYTRLKLVSWRWT